MDNNYTIDKLRIIEKMRKDFVANVSHELRTPLTVIHGYLELLIDQCPPENPEWKEIFSKMYQHSSRMKRIIEDLLLLSNLEVDYQIAEEEKQQVLLKPLLELICHDAEILSDGEHHIASNLEENLFILGQEKELHSAFSNLIFNAVKYTPAGGKIYVNCYRDKDEIHVDVTDTGIGISEKHIPRLTERFYRVDKGRSRASGGTGLGLAIVKHVLIRHNGSLVITSEPNKGSTFSCVFNISE
jgi:two-component system phosphate regulon sensor histidine kinase PhoR